MKENFFENLEETRSENEQKLTFRYNREERLKNAPDIVKQFYDGKFKSNKGFAAIFSNKGNRYMLITLVVLVAFIWIYEIFYGKNATAVIDNITFEVQAFSFDEQVFTTIKIDSKKSKKIGNPINIQADVFVINADNQIVDKTVLTFVYKDGEEFMRYKTSDFEIKKVKVLLKVNDKTKELSTDVKR